TIGRAQAPWQAEIPSLCPRPHRYFCFRWSQRFGPTAERRRYGRKCELGHLLLPIQLSNAPIHMGAREGGSEATDRPSDRRSAAHRGAASHQQLTTTRPIEGPREIR